MLFVLQSCFGLTLMYTQSLKTFKKSRVIQTISPHNRFTVPNRLTLLVVWTRAVDETAIYDTLRITKYHCTTMVKSPGFWSNYCYRCRKKNCRWVSRGLTSHSTLYRSFRGRFLQARWPNQQRQSAEGSQFATEIVFSPTRTTPLCYNMNCRQPPLG